MYTETIALAVHFRHLFCRILSQNSELNCQTVAQLKLATHTSEKMIKGAFYNNHIFINAEKVLV